MSNLLAQNIFNCLKELTIKASSSRNTGIIIDEVPKMDMSILGEYNYMDLQCRHDASDGSAVTFRYHSYDPSGPFQNLPDTNKIDIKLIHHDQVIEEYSCHFDDK